MVPSSILFIQLFIEFSVNIFKRNSSHSGEIIFFPVTFLFVQMNRMFHILLFGFWSWLRLVGSVCACVFTHFVAVYIFFPHGFHEFFDRNSLNSIFFSHFLLLVMSAGLHTLHNNEDRRE